MKYFTLNFNMKLQPMDRGEIEDAFDEFLKTLKVGYVDGGGTLLSENGEIKSCDIELALKKHDPNTLNKIIKAIEEMGVAKGSKLIGKKTEYPMGTLDGLALYLNGTELGAEVYKAYNSDDLLEQLNNIMGDKGRYCSHWQGQTETALYFYGASFDEMKKSIETFVSEYPLCQKARIVQIA